MIQLRDWLIIGVNCCESQKKLLLKQDLIFNKARTICEQSDVVSGATAEHSVVHFQKTQSHPFANSHRWKPPAEKMTERGTKPVTHYF